MKLPTLFAITLAACAGAQRASPGADCATVAEHLVVLAERDHGGGAGALGADLQSELERRCRDDGWSAERRACLAAAQDQEATLACPLE